MKAKNDLEKLLPILKAIPADKVIEPDRPVGIIVQEAYELANAAHQYRPHLLAVGVSAELLDGIVTHANALSAAQTEWTHVREMGFPAALHATIDAATVVRRDLVDSSHYALRNDGDALAIVSRIQEGEGVADICQDLKDLAALTEKYRAEFDRIDFDFEIAKRARALATEVLTGHAAATTKKVSTEAKSIRDRAFTHLDDAVDEVRAAGLFAFRRDADSSRLAKFRSAYAIRRERRRKTGSAASPFSSNAAAATAAAASTGPAGTAPANNCTPR
ncbi:MAG: hypothetical protein HYY84_00440 [Deltaproteobacteria bacterium]|nr:hypothetical protein [Deltaproteobacteria bacterium]